LTADGAPAVPHMIILGVATLLALLVLMVSCALM
jgi:hypothetical protein